MLSKIINDLPSTCNDPISSELGRQIEEEYLQLTAAIEGGMPGLQAWSALCNRSVVAAWRPSPFPQCSGVSAVLTAQLSECLGGQEPKRADLVLAGPLLFWEKEMLTPCIPL